MQKTGLIVGIVVALALVAGAWLLFSSYRAPATPGPVGEDINTPGTFSSQSIGLAFTYPEHYQLDMHEGGEGGAEQVITLIDKANLPVGQNTEGPPAISVSVFANPNNLPLDEWIRTTPASNYHLSAMGEMGASTVGNESGLGYTYSGLYEETAIAVAHGGKIYLFSVGTITADDQIKKDFFSMLESVTFL